MGSFILSSLKEPTFYHLQTKNIYTASAAIR